jgi:hypothetical protein
LFLPKFIRLSVVHGTIARDVELIAVAERGRALTQPKRINMNSKLSEETDVSLHSGENPDFNRRDERLADAKTRRPDSLGDIAAIIALSIAFCTLLLVSMRSTPSQPPVMVQTFELPARPIWISNLPYAPIDGLAPDVGQPQQPQILPAN